MIGTKNPLINNQRIFIENKNSSQKNWKLPFYNHPPITLINKLEHFVLVLTNFQSTSQLVFWRTIAKRQKHHGF